MTITMYDMETATRFSLFVMQSSGGGCRIRKRVCYLFFVVRLLIHFQRQRRQQRAVLHEGAANTHCFSQTGTDRLVAAAASNQTTVFIRGSRSFIESDHGPRERCHKYDAEYADGAQQLQYEYDQVVLLGGVPKGVVSTGADARGCHIGANQIESTDHGQE